MMFIAKMTIDGNPPGSRQFQMDNYGGGGIGWIEGPSPFTERIEFTFDPKVNVFIGPNASGKSTVLRQVLDNYHREWAGYGAAAASEPEFSYIGNQPVHLTKSGHFVLALENHDADNYRGNYDVIIVPATRVRYGVAPAKDGLITDTGEHNFFGVESLSEVLYADHIHSTISALQRTIQGNPIEGSTMPKGRTYTDDELLHPPAGATAENNPQKAGRGLNEALAIAHECAKKICREVVSGDRPQNTRIIRNVKTESELPAAEVSFELGVSIQTNDIRDGLRVDPLDMTSLSAGTEGAIWWTRLIALSLLFMHEFEPGWQNRRAILLIDEIENHLHPTWQRRVIPALLEHFPGLQIFATTHSPFVVAGLKAGQVHLLNRDENGVVTATTNTEDIEGWTADEILRVYMGVHDPTDQATADAAVQLRRLRNEGPRADERGEEERQAEIRRLRQIVDRAELSGPRAAEDARFLADLEAILERYKETQDLNQENG